METLPLKFICNASENSSYLRCFLLHVCTLTPVAKMLEAPAVWYQGCGNAMPHATWPGEAECAPHPPAVVLWAK